ncbi:Uncharacterised protein [Chlamydia trachomatis]|nr:Uncharacterised protein [Chlamydia trachomatis]
MRNSLEHCLTEAGENQDQDDDAFPGDKTHGLCIAQAHTYNHGESNDGIETQTGSKCQRIVGDNTHEDSHDACNKRGTCRNTLGSNRAILRQCCPEDGWVHDKNVGHGEEGDDTATNFLADRRSAFADLEERIN